MKSFGIGILLLFLAIWSANGQFNADHFKTGRVVCFYNSTSFIIEGLGKLTYNDLEDALFSCSHLVYGYAGIDGETFKIKPLNEKLDLDFGKGYYRTISTLKRKFPHLKILLSVGGNSDPEYEKYLTLLESNSAIKTFASSAYDLVKTYDFDGLDVAWQFPQNKPKKVHSSIGSFFKKIKKTFTGDFVLDEKAEEHKTGYKNLIYELKNVFRKDGLILSLTVLPNVNSTLFYDIPALINNLDFVNLAAFDWETPNRQPKLADYPAPIYAPNDRNPQHNVNYQVLYWLNNNCPSTKINLGIPTYGRAWQMTSDSGTTGVPPVPEVTPEVNSGPQSLISGLLSWPEICAILPNPSNSHLKGENLRKVNDPTRRFGPYAYRLPDSDGNHGIWIGFEDPESILNKIDYVREKHLGGVAIFDLSYDDFRGTCSREKYPILKSAKARLDVKQ